MVYQVEPHGLGNNLHGAGLPSSSTVERRERRGLLWRGEAYRKAIYCALGSSPGSGKDTCSPWRPGKEKTKAHGHSEVREARIAQLSEPADGCMQGPRCAGRELCRWGPLVQACTAFMTTNDEELRSLEVPLTQRRTQC